MIKFTTKWFGLDTLAKEEFEALIKPTERAIMKATLFYEGRVKKKLSGPRSGRIYIVNGRPHQASAPGEPPASMTGALRQSITHTDVIWEGFEAHAEVGSNKPYAARLEWGGVDDRGIRILPRPYFSATWEEEEPHMQAILDSAVKTHAVLADFEAEAT
jgi:phage gpG-like protein